MYDNNELYHFNPFHDRLGRFARSGTGSTSGNKRTRQDSAENSKKKSFKLSNKQKTVLKIGAVAVGTALAAYGGYKAYQYIRSENRAYHLGKDFLSKENFLRKVDRLSKPSPEIIKAYGLDFAINDMKSNQKLLVRDGITKSIGEADKESIRTAAQHVKQMRKDLKPFYKPKRNDLFIMTRLVREAEERVKKNRENQKFFRMISKSGQEYLDGLWK